MGMAMTQKRLADHAGLSEVCLGDLIMERQGFRQEKTVKDRSFLTL